MTLDYKGSKVFYEESGSGPSCVLLHGFLENHHLWDELQAVLRANYRVIRIDLPGHGQSELPDEKLSIQKMAKRVQAALATLGIDKTCLIGHSMGGYVSLALAEEFPQLVSGLLLLNAAPGADTASRKEARAHGVAVANKNYEAIVKMSVANLFSQINREAYREKIEFLKNEALKTPQKAYIAAQYAMMKRPDLSAFFKRASSKKSMILGEDDALINASEVRTEFKDTDVEITILQGGHQLIVENFEKTTARIQDFLEQVY